MKCCYEECYNNAIIEYDEYLYCGICFNNLKQENLDEDYSNFTILANINISNINLNNIECKLKKSCRCNFKTGREMKIIYYKVIDKTITFACTNCKGKDKSYYSLNTKCLIENCFEQSINQYNNKLYCDYHLNIDYSEWYNENNEANIDEDNENENIIIDENGMEHNINNLICVYFNTKNICTKKHIYYKYHINKTNGKINYYCSRHQCKADTNSPKIYVSNSVLNNEIINENNYEIDNQENIEEIEIKEMSFPSSCNINWINLYPKDNLKYDIIYDFIHKTIHKINEIKCCKNHLNYHKKICSENNAEHFWYYLNDDGKIEYICPSAKQSNMKYNKKLTLRRSNPNILECSYKTVCANNINSYWYRINEDGSITHSCSKCVDTKKLLKFSDKCNNKYCYNVKFEDNDYCEYHLNINNKTKSNNNRFINLMITNFEHQQYNKTQQKDKLNQIIKKPTWEEKGKDPISDDEKVVENNSQEINENIGKNNITKNTKKGKKPKDKKEYDISNEDFEKLSKLDLNIIDYELSENDEELLEQIIEPILQERGKKSSKEKSKIDNNKIKNNYINLLKFMFEEHKELLLNRETTNYICSECGKPCGYYIKQNSYNQPIMNENNETIPICQPCYKKEKVRYGFYNKLCIIENCNNSAECGYKNSNITIYCKNHKNEFNKIHNEKRKKDPSHLREIIILGKNKHSLCLFGECSVRASLKDINTNKLISCSKHQYYIKKLRNIELSIANKPKCDECKNEDKDIIAHYGKTKEDKPTKCSFHGKPLGYIEIRERDKCLDCDARALFGNNKTPNIYCGTCVKNYSDEGYFNTDCKTLCIKCKKKRPSKNYKGEYARYCAGCAEEGMVRIYNEYCECGTQAHYGYENDEKPSKCICCKDGDMIPLIGNICRGMLKNGKQCTKFASIGYDKPIYCSKCAEDKDNMKNIYAPKCVKCKTVLASLVLKDTNKITHCVGCIPEGKRNNYIYINKIYCEKECGCLAENGSNLCVSCNDDRNKYSHEKEKIVKLFLEKELSNYNFIHNKNIFGKNSYRPDFLYITEDRLIIIEVDEEQHKRSGYSKDNDFRRMKFVYNLFNKMNKKIIFIRYNPDKYRIKNQIIQSDNNKRLSELKNLFLECNNKQVETLSNKLNIYYMYYDGYGENIHLITKDAN